MIYALKWYDEYHLLRTSEPSKKSAQITCYSTKSKNIADQCVDFNDISSQHTKMNNENNHLNTQTKPQSKCISVVKHSYSIQNLKTIKQSTESVVTLQARPLVH